MDLHVFAFVVSATAELSRNPQAWVFIRVS